MQSGPGVHIRRLLLPVYLPMVLLSTGMFAPAAAFPQYLGGLGASLAVAGIVISLRGFGTLLIDLPGGLLISRFRLVPVMFVCLVSSALLSAGIAFTRNVAVIGVFTLASGAARSVVITAMMSYVRLTVPAGVRGRALSGAGGSMRVGVLIGPVVGGVVSERLGVPWAFALQAVCTGTAGMLVALSPDRSVGAPPDGVRPSFRNQFGALRDGLKGRWFALVTVGFGVAVLMVLRSAREYFLPLWGDSIGLSVTTIAWVMSAGAAMDLLLFIPAGQIMDKAGRKVAACICIGVFSAGTLLIPLSSGLAGFLVASALIGLGNGFGAGINMTLGTDLAPSGAVSTFLGAWRLFGDVGSTAGPAVVGALAMAVGLSASLFVTAGIGAVGLLVMALVAPETLKIDPR